MCIALFKKGVFRGGGMDGTCLPNAFCIKRLYAKLNTIKLVAAKGLRWKLPSLLLLLSVFMYN